MVEDKQLIAQYAAEGAESAFTELVRRHLNLVYATALRHVNGDCHLAEDIAQNVFADLARKAKRFTRAVSIAGWLYTSTRFAAAKAVRSESRRRAREEAASAMTDPDTNPADGPNDLRFLVDDALGQLAEKDREAIVLRYFELSEFAAVGAALGVSQNAARMRVERSLDKLRSILEKRGLTTTSAVLAAALSEWAAKAAPAELAAVVVRSALAQTGAGGIALSPFAKLYAALTSKVVAAAVVLAVFAASIYVVQHATMREPDAAMVVARPSARAGTPVVGKEAAALEMPKGDPHLLQKLMERRNARLAQSIDDQWNKKLAAFADWLKDEPGIKKFGAHVRTTVAPGQTLITGGWSNDSGKRAVAFLTTTQIDHAGNRTPVGTGSDQVLVDCRLIEAPNAILDSVGLRSVSASGNESEIERQMPADQAESIWRALTITNGVEALSDPRVTTLVSREAQISVSRLETIEGKQQDVGLRVSVLPIQAAADGSVELGVTVRLTLPMDAKSFGLNDDSDAPGPAPQAANSPSGGP